ncbi:urea transport system ATP-binding protein [Chitinophaga jiangningensis]|uniref:Urea transport system ATP-binding protein n=1 Tax=Chitinophaga jiangningensis TaxID=1419482 RepID=A0A1M7CLP7_9BACT|nr:urea ABC transporter ATP-binding protein UrtD [Chitinophaga jiangningensis]SHL67749.1 urea transport system ATP-binding protein [Chitinophaga jiangningensis]
MLLTVNNLSVSFGGVHALNLDHFSVGEKELRVIIGPNGAGKSTLLDIICGKTRADSGEVTFKGKQILGKNEVTIAEMGIGRKFQKPSIFPELTVYDNLLLAVKTKKDIFSTLFFRVTPAIADRIHSVAMRLQLNGVMYKLAGALAHGQKQWLEIAIVMLQDPTLMLIDEPAAGMSDEETEKTGGLLLELAKTHSIIVIEHDMKFIEQIANNLVTVLVRGKRLMEGTFDEVKNDQRVIDCYLGRSNAQLETL